MEPFDVEMRTSIVEARAESLRSAMGSGIGPGRERPPRRRPVRSRLGRGLIALGERLELQTAR